MNPQEILYGSAKDPDLLFLSLLEPPQLRLLAYSVGVKEYLWTDLIHAIQAAERLRPSESPSSRKNGYLAMLQLGCSLQLGEKAKKAISSMPAARTAVLEEWLLSDLLKDLQPADPQNTASAKPLNMKLFEDRMAFSLRILKAFEELCHRIPVSMVNYSWSDYWKSLDLMDLGKSLFNSYLSDLNKQSSKSITATAPAITAAFSAVNNVQNDKLKAHLERLAKQLGNSSDPIAKALVKRSPELWFFYLVAALRILNGEIQRKKLSTRALPAANPQPDTTPFKVLCLKGGGMRGVHQVALLNALFAHQLTQKASQAAASPAHTTGKAAGTPSDQSTDAVADTPLSAASEAIDALTTLLQQAFHQVDDSKNPIGASQSGLGPFMPNLDIGRHFDMIAGTSTGSFIACALGAGIPLHIIQTVYFNFGEHIFSQQNKWLSDTMSLLRGSGLLAGENALHSLLHGVLGNIDFGAIYRQRNIALCIPAVDLNGDAPVLFKTPHMPIDPASEANLEASSSSAHGTSHTLKQGPAESAAPSTAHSAAQGPASITASHQATPYMLLKDACLASSACPVLRAIAHVHTAPNAPAHYYVDGGLYANSPTAIAALEAIEYLRATGQEHRPIHMFFVGAIDNVEDRPKDRARAGSWLNDGRIFMLPVNAQENAHHQMAKTLLRLHHPESRYITLPCSLKGGDLSDTRPETLQGYENTAIQDAQAFLQTPEYELLVSERPSK